MMTSWRRCGRLYWKISQRRCHHKKTYQCLDEALKRNLLCTLSPYSARLRATFKSSHRPLRIVVCRLWEAKGRTFTAGANVRGAPAEYLSHMEAASLQWTWQSSETVPSKAGCPSTLTPKIQHLHEKFAEEGNALMQALDKSDRLTKDMETFEAAARPNGCRQHTRKTGYSGKCELQRVQFHTVQEQAQ